MDKIKAFASYLFNSAPGKEFKFYIPLIILAVILILGSIVFAIIYKQRKKHDFALKRLFKKFSSRLALLGLLFLFLIAVRAENIPYFSMRILLYLSFLLLIFFAYKYIKVYKVTYPKEKENVNTIINRPEKHQNKYLPNKKK